MAEEKTVEEIKAEMKEELEAGAAGDDEEKEQNRYQKLANENRELREANKALQTTIGTTKSEYQKQIDKAELEKGNFPKVLEGRDATISQLQGELEAERLNVKRVTIGLEQGIPLKWCKAIPGSDAETILANAVSMAEDLPKPKATTTDATGLTPQLGSQKPVGRYQPVSTDVV